MTQLQRTPHRRAGPHRRSMACSAPWGRSTDGRPASLRRLPSTRRPVGGRILATEKFRRRGLRTLERNEMIAIRSLQPLSIPARSARAPCAPRTRETPGDSGLSGEREVNAHCRPDGDDRLRTALVSPRRWTRRRHPNRVRAAAGDGLPTPRGLPRNRSARHHHPVRGLGDAASADADSGSTNDPNRTSRIRFALDRPGRHCDGIAHRAEAGRRHSNTVGRSASTSTRARSGLQDT